MIVDFNQGGLLAIQEKAASLGAYGKTPIARSLSLAAKDLEPYSKHLPTILLVTDGKETCGGNPIQVVEDLKAQGVAIRVFVVGLDLDALSKEQLRKLARAGNGKYYDAKSSEELKFSLQSALIDLAKLVDDANQERLAGATDHQGGSSLSSAKRIQAGHYKLEEDLPPGRRAFYQVITKAAQSGVITGKPAGSEQMEIDLYDPIGKKILNRSRTFKGLECTKSAEFIDQAGKGFYFSVGSDVSTVTRGSGFELIIKETGDLRPGQDSPEFDGASIMRLPWNLETTAHLGLEDHADAFLIESRHASKQANLNLVFDDPDFIFEIQILSATGEQLLKSYPRNSGHGNYEVASFPDEGVVVVIRDQNPDHQARHSSYTLRVGSQANH
jgi:hypothetical protein